MTTTPELFSPESRAASRRALEFERALVNAWLAIAARRRAELARSLEDVPRWRLLTRGRLRRRLAHAKWEVGLHKEVLLGVARRIRWVDEVDDCAAQERPPGPGSPPSWMRKQRVVGCPPGSSPRTIPADAPVDVGIDGPLEMGS